MIRVNNFMKEYFEYVLYIIFSFFLVFAFQFKNSIMYSNLIFYILVIYYCFTHKKNPGFKLELLAFFLTFYLIVIISVILYSYKYGVNSRNIIQLLFTSQYVIFAFSIDFNYKFIKKVIYFFSILASIYLIYVLIITKTIFNLSSIFTIDRMWAMNYIPGWPNTFPIPLLFALFINFKEKLNKLVRILLIFALILTTSRSALLGILLIIIYYIFKNISLKNMIKGSVSIFVLLVIFTIFIYNSKIFESFYSRLFYFTDRAYILQIVKDLVPLRLFFGYGGNTLDQIFISVNYVPVFYYNHTHNWVFEILIRYGTLGLVFFILYLYKIYRYIKIKDNRTFYIILLILGLFQIYIREFTYIYILYLVVIDGSLNNINKSMEVAK